MHFPNETHPKALALDASGLVQLNCDRRFWLTVVKGVQANTPSPFTSFGSAAHKFLEEYAKNPNIDQAKLIFDCAKKYALNNFVEKLPAAVLKVLHWESDEPKAALDENGNPLVEVKFSKLFHNFKYAEPHDEETFPINLVGTIDKIFVHNNCVVIRDYKFPLTSNRDYIHDYELNLQMYFYLYVIKKWPDILPPALRPYIEDNRIYGEYLACHYNAKSPFIVQSVPVYFTESINEEFHEMLILAVDNAINIAFGKYSNLPPPNGIMTSSCKYCTYQYICRTPNLNTQQNIITAALSSAKPYNPHAFRD